MRFSQELGLSEDQVMKLHTISEAHRDAMEIKGLAAHQAQRAVHEALRDPSVSSQSLATLAGTASTREAALLEEVRKVNAESWQVLTAAQRDKAKALMARPDQGRRGDRSAGPMGGSRPQGGPGGFGGPEGPGGRRQGPPPDGPED